MRAVAGRLLVSPRPATRRQRRASGNPPAAAHTFASSFPACWRTSGRHADIAPSHRMLIHIRAPRAKLCTSGTSSHPRLAPEQFAGPMETKSADIDPHALAGALLRAARAHAGVSQRELAARLAVAASMVGRAEGSRGPAPSWALVVRAVAACGCSITITPDDPPGRRVRSWEWEFEDVRDKAARHLPAHLEVWPVLRASEWSSFHKYSCFANPPFPPYSYWMRRRR